MIRDDIQNFKDDAQDALNDLAGKLAGILHGADKGKRDKLQDIENEEKQVRDKINKIDEDAVEDRWNDTKNEIKESLQKIKSDLETL